MKKYIFKIYLVYFCNSYSKTFNVSRSLKKRNITFANSKTHNTNKFVVAVLAYYYFLFRKQATGAQQYVMKEWIKKKKKKAHREEREMLSKQTKQLKEIEKNQCSKENQRLCSEDVAQLFEFKRSTIKALSLLKIRLRKPEIYLR